MPLFAWSADKNSGSVARGKTSSSYSILFPINLKRIISMNICFQICLSWIYFDFWAKFFLLGNAEFTKRPLLREQTGVVNNLSSTKLSYSKWKNAVLNPSKSFLAIKKVNPRILSTFKRSFSKKKGKTPSPYIMHLLGGECCWTVRDSQLIRLLKSPRWLSVYTAISREVVGKNVHATIPKGNMGYDQYTVPDTVAVEPTFVAFL